MVKKPCVMVSSTFYDLKQIREDLRSFIEDEIGYVPLLSELSSFPVDPDTDAITNCRRRIAEADILVLIIGGRYGSQEEQTSKSITNLEYLEARAIGIPVYAFLVREMESLLPVWEKNPNADFSNVVDNPDIFKFINQVRSLDSVWTFLFEKALDIVNTLRTQFAYLFATSLEYRRKFEKSHLSNNYLNQLGPEALRIVFEKPIYWEYMLYFQVWIDEIEKRADKIFEYEAGIDMETSETIQIEITLSWIQTRLYEFTTYLHNFEILQKNAEEAFSKLGQAGNENDIIQVSKKLDELLKALLDWSKRVKRAYVEEPMRDALKELARFPDDIIKKMKIFPSESLKKIKEKIPGKSNEEIVELKMVFELSNEIAFNKAIDIAQNNINLKSINF